MISIVCWLWDGRGYQPAHVNVLQSMFARTLSIPHRFICISDQLDGFSQYVEVIPTPLEAAEIGRIASPEGTRFPSCYRRLWNFSGDAAKALGERILAIDIDLVVVQDLAPLFEPEPVEDFIGVRPLMKWGKAPRVAGGMYYLTTGTHTAVWNTFRKEPHGAIAAARAAGHRGSDQAWLSHCLADHCRVWDESSGLYSIRDIANGKLPLPADARLVQFNGPVKPWQSALPWVHDHWR